MWAYKGTDDFVISGFELEGGMIVEKLPASGPLLTHRVVLPVRWLLAEKVAPQQSKMSAFGCINMHSRRAVKLRGWIGCAGITVSEFSA